MQFFASASGELFPAVETIPLPAPVWLFRILHELTLVLHFAALYPLLGGLMVCIVMNAFGHLKRRSEYIESSNAIAGWLPTIMTYVINLGVPPLLFSQVLYGRALYTSSVLIGASWIAVIPLLIACYHLLYVMKARGAAGKAWYLHGLASMLLAWMIARIYSMNMSLMNDPNLWRDAYRDSQTGSTMLAGAASWHRWTYMLAAGLATGGVFFFWLSRSVTRTPEAVKNLRFWGVRLAQVGTVVAVCCGIAGWYAQSDAIRETCSSSSMVWLIGVGAWLLGAVGLLGAATVIGLPTTNGGWKLPALASLMAFLQTAGFVLCRDLIRDASLAQYGFDVSARTVNTNWSVLGLFFFLFVVGLALVGWLASIAYRAEVTPATTTPATAEVQ